MGSFLPIACVFRGCVCQLHECDAVSRSYHAVRSRLAGEGSCSHTPAMAGPVRKPTQYTRDLMKPFTRLLFVLSLLGCPALAQIATTSLRGTVVDPSGAVVGGADVSISEAASGFRATRKTAAKGEDTFPQRAPGRCPSPASR